MKSTRSNLVGLTAGRLGVYGLAFVRSHTFWNCVCVCGKEVVRSVDQLTPRSSCGCERIRHGGVGSPEYRAWQHMKERCLNPSDPRYHRYGGRGITVCERWLDFSNFIADMGPRPSPSHSLDRINNDGSYELANCRWATRKEQQQNTVTAKWLTYNGSTKTLGDWARHLGISHGALLNRLRKWPIDRALTAKSR
jgi:hypothetical protein